MTPGALIRQARDRHGLSQARLALRAGTKQSAISRLEADEVSPTVETLRLLLNAMGDDLELSVRPLRGDHDPLHRRANARLTPDERLTLAASWNRLARRLTAAERQAHAGD